jgi:hydroxyacylglutathione hydrolase
MNKETKATMILRTLQVGQLASNCYLVGCERTRHGIVIDPGADAAKIQRAIDEADLQIGLIVLTHYHFDHIQAVGPLQESTGAQVAIHAQEADLLKDPPMLFRYYEPEIPMLEADRLLQDGERFTVGDLEIVVMHTPGHSPGGISLYIASEKVVFSGDTLFREGIGRSDFPGGDMSTLAASIRDRLYTLDDETVVYSGHGPKTSIGWEKRNNPFVRP